MRGCCHTYLWVQDMVLNTVRNYAGLAKCQWLIFFQDLATNGKWSGFQYGHLCIVHNFKKYKIIRFIEALNTNFSFISPTTPFPFVSTLPPCPAKETLPGFQFPAPYHLCTAISLPRCSFNFPIDFWILLLLHVVNSHLKM